MNSILITGGAGFIGSNLSDFFLKKSWLVSVLDDLSTGNKKNVQEFAINKNFQFIKGNINNLDLLSKIIKKNKITHISHQAARGSVSKSIIDPIGTNEINISGTLKVLWAAHQLGVKKVVCAISSSIYGDTPELPKKESMALNPLSPYAITKAANEMYCKVFNDLYKIPVVGLRYFNVYGKKQNPAGDYAAVIPKFIQNALENKPLIIFGDGKQTRDFTYIEDVLAANYLALTKKTANGRSFNVAYGNQINILDLAKEIIRISKSSSKIIFKASRPGDVHDSLASLTYAKKYLNYKPRWPLHKGLEETIEIYQKNYEKTF